MGWPPRAAPSSARIPLSLSLSPIISGGAPAPRPPRGLAPLPPPPASPPPMTASSPNQCSLMGHPCTPMPSYDTILSTWVPFTHVPFHHVTLSLSRGCHHCQHCWADRCDGSCQRGCCKGGIPAITDPGGKALGGMSFRSPSCCASCRKQPPTLPPPSASPPPSSEAPSSVLPGIPPPSPKHLSHHWNGWLLALRRAGLSLLPPHSPTICSDSRHPTRRGSWNILIKHSSDSFFK